MGLQILPLSDSYRMRECIVDGGGWLPLSESYRMREWEDERVGFECCYLKLSDG